MKLLFIPAKSTLKVSLSSVQIAQLPQVIGIIATVQFTNQLEHVKASLEKQGKKILTARGKNLELGQILGCDVQAALKIKNKVKAFLYIGSGVFHPLQVALAADKPVFCFNPETKKLSLLNEKEISKARARQKSQKIKFLTASKLGILVSTKPGQQKLKQAFALKDKLEKEGKSCYIFMFDNFQAEQLENWPEIECWINTACPGLSLEKPLAWIDDII